MRKRLFITISILAMASLLLSVPSYSQDKDLLARADSLHQQGRVLISEERYEDAIRSFEEAADIRKQQLGEFSVDLANSINNIGTCYRYLNDDASALDYYKQSLAIRRVVLEEGHPNFVTNLNNLGICYESIGDYDNALKLYEEEASILKRIYGDNHPNYASSLNNIGVCYENLDDFDSALDYYEQASTIWRQVLGEEAPDYATSLNNIGNCYYYLGDYDIALEHYQQASSIFQTALGEEDEDFVNSLKNISLCYDLLGNYAKELEYQELISVITGRVLGLDHPDYASTLNDIGLCYDSLGDYSQALDYFKQALSIWGTSLGTNHPDYASALNNIGNCYDSLGNYSEALGCYEQALAIWERTFGKAHRFYAAILNNIGSCYLARGNSSMALEYLLQSSTISETLLGKDHPDYAGSLSNIGMCYTNLGNHSKALEYYKQALEIRERTLGNNHPECALSLNDLGVCYDNLGNYSKALDYYEKALLITKDVFGEEHPDYAGILNNIGCCYVSLGDNAQALGYFERALDIRKMLFGEDHPETASSLSNIGCCYNNLHKYDEGLVYLERASLIIQQLLGKDHSEYARNLKNIGNCFIGLGNRSQASVCLSAYSDITSSIVSRLFSSLTESQRAIFWEEYSCYYTDELYKYTILIHSPEMNQVAYDGALFGKGLLLNAEAEMRKLILESGDEEALRMYNEVQERQIKLDRLYEDPVGKRDAIDSLNNDIENRQQELMKRSKVFGDYTRNLALKWTDVQAALGKKDIAIEFETYTHKDTTFYFALTLRPGYTEPHLVELFNNKDLGQISSKRYYTSTKMTDLVWGNLSDELNGVKNVYFSPAGELNNIGIEYLLDRDGRHLISEKRNYYRLTSTRELAKEHSGKMFAGATLYGGIRYDISPSSSLTGEETESERLALTATRSWMPMDSLSVTRGGWVYLPGTKEEAEAISSTLSSKKVQNNLLEGENGTEESFKALSGTKRDVIHIATHGFYWTETEAARSGMETSSFMLDGESQAPKEDKALTRSGLLFAGAQNAFEGKDIPIDVEDGILTAKDISRMDLRGTDLVVISACQSGLGEVTGDGVFGLQRGFKKAGVQSIVMSLWEVSDEATKIMMTRFYENLAKGRSKYDSFREAQSYLRKYEKGRYDEPEFYAAFVLLDAIK